ncbi:LytR/AlgR family response regulator transcription factor [Rhodocytophaga aerolata]|nr:LytTR family DNA-binding domain-containing protein [Rhodocytophaga aerolata]
MVKINIRDIEYIESLEDYIRIHLMGSKPVMTLMPIKKAVEKLPSGKLKWIHRSYVVRIDQVKAIGKRKVVLASGKELPVGESYEGFNKEWMHA